MRIGVDVGGTNTDAVLLDGGQILAVSKQPTSADVSEGIRLAIQAVLAGGQVRPDRIQSVMIGTTHFTNALVEMAHLDQVAVIRLASPSGEALPPMTAWPKALTSQLGQSIHLLPGGYEVDGREIAALDEGQLRHAAQCCRASGIRNIAVSCAFAPISPAMEIRAARVIAAEYPEARISLSHTIGSLGLVERENGTILNAALQSLALRTITAFEQAIADIGLKAPLFISQNDGTLIFADAARRLPVMTIGSGPTNSMRGAAFLTGETDAIVMDVGGTTCDIGVLVNGFPRESTIASDIGGVRTNFRMPDILAIGLGGGTRIRSAADGQPSIGPDSVGYKITEDALIFGGNVLTASDIAVAAGHADFGEAKRLPQFAPGWPDMVWQKMQALLADSVDRMKTARGDALVIAVGGGHFLISDQLEGARRVVRPRHAEVANAIGAAIAQVGAQAERVLNYDLEPRDAAHKRLRAEITNRVIAAGGDADSVQIVDVEEVYLSYLPGRSAQVRMKAVADLELSSVSQRNPTPLAERRHAH